MRYIGSKISTINNIYELVSRQIPIGSFCDPFGGLGSVASHFKSMGYDVWSGDILKFPFLFQKARLKYEKPLSFKKIINKLNLNNLTDLETFMNSLPPKNGWFVREYSENRQYFTNYNAKKIQSCRRAIAFWSAKGWINGEEKAVMLASLINSLDKVANTAGTYYAFLKKWHRKALNQFRFQFIMPASLNGKGHCFNETAEELVKRRDFDILYLDPPYNQRSYGHYYHLPETIALEGTPVVHGQSGIPIKINTKSKFNNKIESKQALLDVLNNAKFKLLVFHYADNGIIPSKNIEEILSPFGKINDFIIDCKGYRTKISPIKTRHHLYIVKNG